MSPEPPIHKVALAGAPGYLGKHVLPALLDANFDVTVLARPHSDLSQITSSTNPAIADVRVVRADFASVPALTEALRGHDAFVSVITTAAAATQKLQVDAAIAAGVRRYVPSEFGSDSSLAPVRELPMYAEKTDTAGYIREKCEAAGKTTYTFVYTNVFLDWALDYGFMLDLKGKKVRLYDGGDVLLTVSPTDFVAKGVVAILRNPEVTANRDLRLQGALTTQREMWGVAKKFLGTDGWTVEESSTAEEDRVARENLKKTPGDLMSWAWGMLVRAIYGEGYSRNFKENNDNELLGLKEISKEDLEGYVKRYIDTGSASVAVE